MKVRKTGLLFQLTCFSLFLAACSSPEGTYKAARNLLAKGEYAQTAEKFESLGSYEQRGWPGFIKTTSMAILTPPERSCSALG